jgi:hypothetical protein
VRSTKHLLDADAYTGRGEVAIFFLTIETESEADFDTGLKESTGLGILKHVYSSISNIL